MPQPRDIYLLDPKLLSPETIAVTFAKTSRSPQTFRQIAAQLTDEKSADFHEKWVVGYGHSSVAEHAVLHIAVENISRLAVECLESNRLAAYTEKSSRYQIWDEDHFYIPPEIVGGALEGEYIQLNTHLFRQYQRAFAALTDVMRRKLPKQKGETERAYEQRVRAICADACRFYLPASALANVGVSINARALEHAITKMLSHSLAEVRQIGQEIKQVAQEHVPTLVKYADHNRYMQRLHSQYAGGSQGESPAAGAEESWFTALPQSGPGENEILAALLYRYGQMPYPHCLQSAAQMAEDEKLGMAADLLGALGEHDIPVRDLEYAQFIVDVVLDQGAYFELKRHRMMTQSPQRLTARLGFAVPALFKQAGLLETFITDMRRAAHTYDKFSAFNQEVAAYLVPNAFNRRVLLHMNLRTALHLACLRSAPNAHFSMRRFALRLAEELRRRFPLFAAYILPDNPETWQSISQEYFYNLNQR